MNVIHSKLSHGYVIIQRMNSIFLQSNHNALLQLIGLNIITVMTHVLHVYIYIYIYLSIQKVNIKTLFLFYSFRPVPGSDIFKCLTKCISKLRLGNIFTKHLKMPDESSGIKTVLNNPIRYLYNTLLDLSIYTYI